VRRAALGLALAALAAGSLGAQATGAIGGRVRDATTGRGVPLARVWIDDGRQGVLTDTAGLYRLREVRSGRHAVRVEVIGYRPARRDSVLVRAGETTMLDFALQPAALLVDSGVVVEAPRADPVLDPLVTADIQSITADEIRRLPVTTLEEAVALSAGTVGESYRGGRVGQQAFVIDGLGVKNQLDASTGPVGLRIPPDLLTEAALITNGFSARYGQAVSGLVNVVTKDGGHEWQGRLAYETDRPFTGAGDLGLDRFVASADGSLGGRVGFVGVIDAQGRLDADPVHAPAPLDSRDPRAASPAMLPHNSAERLDVGAKLRVPLGAGTTVRLFGLRSLEQRLLYDPLYKYDLEFAPAQRVGALLASGHVQRFFGTTTADLRVGWFQREFVRGALERQPEYLAGAFTGERYRIIGEDVARAQDTAAAMAALPGFGVPGFSDRTRWGVPAFFQGGAPRGDVAWNRFRELRGQLDVAFGAGSGVDLFVGGEASRQRVETFQRVLAYLPVDSGVPPPTASDFTPLVGAAYAEAHLRGPDFAVTAGVRYDRFTPGTDLPGAGAARQRVNPRVAFSTVLKGATFIASWGRFSQTPDFQYLVDAAFDDTARTGRFRRGNPNLGFETATQYEFSLRTRPSEHVSVRGNVYSKQLDGLVASVPLGVDPDSTVFGNLDFGTVRGLELILERELRDGWGLRVGYTLQGAQATATDAYELARRIRVGPVGDTIDPANLEFPLDYDRRHGLVLIAQGEVPDGKGPRIAGRRVLAGLEGAAIFRYNSGLPYTRTNAAGDTLIGLPNSWRLPPNHTLDLLLRLPLRLAGTRGSLYLDVRNVLNRRNVEAVRRETGSPELTEDAILAFADSAYRAHPEAIPYESPRYRPDADLDRNGRIEGASELVPMYEAAARDFYQPLFAYGPPRLLRFGLEFVF
jgi:hypothetical protein